MKFTVVLPYVYEPYMQECVATMAPEFERNVVFVNNTVNNRGIMWSHNQGVQSMYDDGADWLIVLGASIRFGKPGGMDFIDELAKSNLNVVEAYPVFGWHLIAFSRDCIDRVGKWDENFTPYSLCDIDMSLRIQKAYRQDARKGPAWEKVKVDAQDMGMAHGLKHVDIKAAYAPRDSYFERKWGRWGGESEKDSYDHPFNDSTKPVSFWPDKDDPLSIWQNEYKTMGWKFDE